MQLNVKKCQVMTFGRNKNKLFFDYTLNGTNLERVNMFISDCPDTGWSWGQPGRCFADLSKTLDCVDPSILTEKIAYLDIYNQVLKWLESYMRGGVMYEDSSEQFSLRWNNFFSNLTSGFHSLWEEEDFVDVTLAADGKLIQAHKIVLSVCSPYFKHLFKVNPCKHPIVILKDVGYKELSGLLQFMYKGEVNVYQEELADFLKTAELLQIKGLTSNDNQASPPQKEESKEIKSSPSLVQSEEKKKSMPSQSSAPSLTGKRKRPDLDQAVVNNTHKHETSTQSLPALPPLEPIEFVESEFPENSNDRLARLFDVDSSKPVTNKPGQRLIANFSQDPMDSAQATFRVTSRGRLQLVQNNYVYHCNRQKDNKIFWKCAEYNRTGCRGRCISIGWAVTVTHALHNHYPVWSEGSDDSKIISDISEMKQIFGSPRTDCKANPSAPAYQQNLPCQPDNVSNVENF